MLTVALLVVSLVAWAAEQPPSTLTFDTLKSTVAQAGSVASDVAQHVTADWTAFAGAPGEALPAARAVPVNQFQLRERRRVSGQLAVERNPELSADQLVVVAADARGAALSWQLIRDPRIVRAEWPGPDGTLTGVVLYRADAHLTLDLPDLPQLVQVHLYQPRWAGDRWDLDLVTSITLGPRQ